MPQRARLFVAVIPPEEILDRLGHLDRPAEDGVRYTTRDQWHVTLRFLGTAPVAEAVVAVATLRAAPAVAEVGPVVSRLGRNAVVVPVSGLDRLAAAVVRATADLGQAPDSRPFAGHLTLARLRRRPACGIAGARLSARFTVDRVHLVRSETHPEGARHEVLVTRTLTGPA